MVECRIEGATARTPMRISDISLSGCFVDTINLMPEGTRITLYARLGPQEVPLTGRIARVQRLRGMGFAVEFDDLSDEARTLLERIVLQQPL